jgi:adenylate cyclase
MEIECKFLVNESLWKSVKPATGKEIKQGYFTSNEQFSVRVRTKGSKGFLTIKGAREGIARDEFEYEIPYEDALFMLNTYCQPYLEKTRYEVNFQGMTWEIDEFHGKLEGLILAEIELETIHQSFEKPDWVTEDVSTNSTYFNSEIIKRLHH